LLKKTAQKVRTKSTKVTRIVQVDHFVPPALVQDHADKSFYLETTWIAYMKETTFSEDDFKVKKSIV